MFEDNWTSLQHNDYFPSIMPIMSMIWCSFNKNAKCNIWMISICSTQKINFTVVAVDSINASNMQTWIYLRKWTILYWVSILISLLKQSLKPEYMCNPSLRVCNELNNARRLVNPTLMWWNLAPCRAASEHQWGNPIPIHHSSIYCT